MSQKAEGGLLQKKKIKIKTTSKRGLIREGGLIELLRYVSVLRPGLLTLEAKL